MSSSNNILITSDGTELPVANASTTVSTNRGMLAAGTDGTTNRLITLDSSGRQLVVGAGTAGTPVGGVVTIQGVSGGVVVPVSGTIAATQSGTWTVQPGNTANTTPWLTTINQGGNSAAVKAPSTAVTATDAALVVAISPNNVISTSSALTVDGTSSFNPDPSTYIIASENLLGDFSGNLQIRGPVLSDEGSFRDDFIGSALTSALTGTLTFTSGSATVTGTGTAFTTELTTNSYIKKTADGEALYARVSSVDSDTSLTLETTYAGTTATTTGVASDWKTSVTGGSITVTNSEVQLASSTANANLVRIVHQGDYLPYTLNIRSRITQRIANQTSFLGFQDVPGSPNQQAVIVFDGTSNTNIKFRTSASSAAADIQETSISLTTGLDTSQTLVYEIDLTPDAAILSVNSTVVATHSNHLPEPYTPLNVVAYITNAAVVTTTTLALDLFYFQNLDVLQIGNTFSGEPIKVQVISNASTSVAGFTFGDVNLAATTQAAVRRTTYTEQTTNFTGSVVSSSALDTAAGTGARTIKITYYDSTGSGPLNETATLNGTTAVNLVSTNHCYIEKIEVLTVGSGGSNVGIITLKTGAAGAGTTVWTIAAGDNRTFGCHHYVGSGKTCNLVDVSLGSTSTTVGQGAFYILKSITLGVANTVESQISDFLQLYGQSSTTIRTYSTPIQIAGPARITAYCTPNGSGSTTYRAAFDFYDQ